MADDNLDQDISRIRSKASQANIEMDRELLEIAMDRAKVFRSFSSDQRKFLKETGERELFLAKTNLAIQARAIDIASQQNNLSEKDIKNLQRRLESNKTLQRITDKTLSSLIEQATNVFDIKELTEAQIDLEIELEALQQDKSKMYKEEFAATANILKTQINIVNTQKQRAVIQEQINKGSKLFGFTQQDIADKAADIGAVYQKIPVLMSLAASAAVRSFESLRSGAQLGVGQTMAMSGAAAGGRMKAWASGIFGGSASEAAAELTKEFGRMDFVSGKIIKKQLELTRIYSMQGSESAQLLELLDVIGKHSADFTDESLSFMENLARANDIPIGALMSSVASSAGDFAVASKESLHNLILASAEAQRLGLDMDKIVSFAESSVMNPDNFIQNIARMRQFGFDIADPMGMMALANDPTRRDELLSRLSDTFAGLGDLGALSTIQRKLIEDTFQIDFESIRKAVTRAGEPLKGAEAGEISGTRETVQNLTASTTNLISGINFTTLALSALAAATAMRTFGGLGKLGGLFGGGKGLPNMSGGLLSKLGGLRGLGMGAAGIGAVGTVGYDAMGLAGGRSGAGAGLVGSILGGIGGGMLGMPTGNPVLGAMIGMSVGSMLTKGVYNLFKKPETGQMVADAAGSVSSTQRADMFRNSEPIVIVDTARLERKMDEMILAIQTQPAIQMDTMRVTKALKRGEERLTSA